MVTMITFGSEDRVKASEEGKVDGEGMIEDWDGEMERGKCNVVFGRMICSVSKLGVETVDKQTRHHVDYFDAGQSGECAEEALACD